MRKCGWRCKYTYLNLQFWDSAYQILNPRWVLAEEKGTCMRQCGWRCIYMYLTHMHMTICITICISDLMDVFLYAYICCLHEAVWLEMYIYVPHTYAYKCTRAWLDVYLYVFMCIHIDGCISICIRLYTYRWNVKMYEGVPGCISICIHLYTCRWMYIYMYTSVQIWMDVYLHVYIYIHIAWLDVHLYVYISIHAYMHIYM